MQKPKQLIESLVRIARDADLSDRDTMLLTSAGLWLGTAFGIGAAGVIAPELAPDPILPWQIGCNGIMVVVVASHATWMRRISDRAAYVLVNFTAALLGTIALALMLANPVSIAALIVSLLPIAGFAAQFFKSREVLLHVVLLTAFALIPVLRYGDDLSAVHVVSRVSAFVPIMWVLAAAVWLSRRNRLDAIAEAEAIALSDPLTGLANLRSFRQRAEELLSGEGARRGNGVTGLLLIDLDDFKSANTYFGHAGGDHLLQMVGESLGRAASENHLVARIGGDEFAVLLEDVDARSIDDQAIRYRNAVRSAEARSQLPDMTVDASVGIAVSGRDGLTVEALMTAADASMYEAKAKPKEPRTKHPSADNAKSGDATRRAETIWAAGSHEPVPDHAHGQTRRGRPANAAFAAGCWAIGVTIGLISLAMPDADRTHGALALMGLLGGYAIAIVAYYTAPPVESPRHVFNDVFTMGSIAFIAYLTGGADSPLWPLVFLLIVYDAWFLGWKRITLRTIGPVLVILLPLSYENISQIDWATGASLYSGVLVSIGLNVLVSYNQVHLVAERNAARHLATIDPRTGLSNRREFQRRVEEAFMADDRAPGLAPAIVMIDLDNFKSVNTDHGHHAGDVLLESIARELASRTRSEDCIARVGGDEFAVVLPEVDAEIAEQLSQRYVDAVADLTAQSELAACRNVTASAGYALYGEHGHTFDELIHEADTALMAVKAVHHADRPAGGVVVSPS